MKATIYAAAFLLVAGVANAQIQYCTVTRTGVSCGPELTVSMQPLGAGGNYALDMTATGLHPRTIGALQWGSNPQSLTLPGGGCLLLCDYVWGHYFQTDDTGSYTWGRAWPHWAIGYYYMQMGSLLPMPNGSFEVRTTTCELVQCFG